jgi:peptidoglycan/xylan/chitin deacetylase (PgdA/CDA1 family)
VEDKMTAPLRQTYILVVFLLISLGISVFLLLDSPDYINESGASWIIKEKEARSRLLSIPILLYHNIDGTGPFSIDLGVIREHFQILKNKGIRVIPLTELINRLENPVPFDDRVVVITFDDGYYSMHTKLVPLVEEFGYPVTLFVYVDNINQKSRKMLSWDLLKQLDSKGIDIQCHTISHADLTRYSRKTDYASRRKLFEELYMSRRIMERNMGKEIQFFAFPYGKYDLEVVHFAELSGYRRVFSTDYGSNILTRNNYCLRRQHIKKSYTNAYIESLVE